MSRIFMAMGLTLAFFGWVLYHLIIKKDLKKNLNNMYLGFFFIGTWVLFYFFIVELF